MAIKLAGVQLGNITGGPSSLNLYELHDVSIVSPMTGQYLRYNAGIAEWQNAFLDADVYDYLTGASNASPTGGLTSSNGVVITPFSGTRAIDIGLSITASADASGTLTSGNLALTLATVNGNVGTFGSSTAIPVVTVNAKGLVTAVTTAAFTGTAPLATSLAGGTTGSLVYQSAPSTTAFLTAGTASQVLIGGASSPSWSSTPAGLTSVTATSFVGALTGNSSTATALQTSRSISASGDATWTVNFDGTSDVSAAITLATVNGSPGQFAVSTTNGKGLVTSASNLSGDITSSGAVTTLATVNASPQTDTFRKVTVNGKGLVTATSAVTPTDITTALGFTPVNVAGDTMSGFLILNADPVAALGAVTKQYVDNIAAGLNVHASCTTATTATLATSSAGTVTYNNGASGVGATLTTTGSFGTIGGATTADGNRILVKNEAAAANNGIYVRTSATVLTRAADFDNAPSSEIDAGDFTYISTGTLQGTNWVQTTPAPVTVGTTAINWSQLSGAGVYTAGTGINITSNSISNTGVLSNVAGTGISVSGATGNVTVTNTGVTSAVAGTNISVSAATGAVTFSVTGTVPTATTATNLAGGAAGSHPYQTGSGTTAMLAAGTSSQVLVSGATPSWTNTPVLTGTNFTGIPNAGLTNSSLTIGSTNIALGATSTTLAGLTSVTSTSFVGAVTGNASTATTLQTARNINGVSFNGSADITVTAAAGTLTGSTLNAGVTASSLTSVGTLGSLIVSGNITASSLGLTAANSGIEIGSTSSSNTPFIDMHSSGNNIDYDVRLIASGGSGSTGQGTLSIQAANVSASQFSATTFTGTLSGSITGNAATVTNNPARTDPTAYPVLWAPNGGITGQPTYSCSAVNIQSSTGTLNATVFAGQTLNGTVQSNFQGSQASDINTSTGSLGGIMIQGPGGASGAFASFHRPGVFAAYLGLDSNSVWSVGGWSMGANKYPLALSGAGGAYSFGATTVSSLNGFVPSQTSGAGSRIVVADSSGYINNTYFNTTADTGSTTASHFAMQTSNDNYIRWMTTANTASFLGPSITKLGTIATINGFSPANGAIRLTPNLHLNSSSGNAVILNWDNGATGAAQTVRIGNGAGADVWYCSQGGAVTQSGALVAGGDVTAFSDIRVKANIIQISDALSKVEQIRGVTFTRTDQEDKVTRHTGVIAQEVEAVLPEAISETGPNAAGEGAGIKTVAYGNMVGLLIEAIKELNAKVDELKAQLAAKD